MTDPDDPPPTPRDPAHIVGAHLHEASAALADARDAFADDGAITPSERQPLLDALERAEIAIHHARRGVLGMR